MISDEDLDVLTISMDVVQRRDLKPVVESAGAPTPLMLLPVIYDAPDHLRRHAAQAVLDLVAEVKSYRRAARLAAVR